MLRTCFIVKPGGTEIRDKRDCYTKYGNNCSKFTPDCSDNKNGWELGQFRHMCRGFWEFSVTLLMSEPAQWANDDDASGFERRRGLRVRQQRPVKIFDSRTNRYFGGQTEDISATGLRIELPSYAPVRQGETLNIHVGLSSRGESLANRRQMIPVRIVWVDRGRAEGATMEAGVEFLASISAHLDAA